MLYLSIPYSSPSVEVRNARVIRVRAEMASLIAEGRLTVCPVAMNHEAMEQLLDEQGPRGAYWIELEVRLAEVCDELVVVAVPGWRESRGVAREIAIFERHGKPVRFIIGEAGQTGGDSLGPSVNGAGLRDGAPA